MVNVLTIFLPLIFIWAGNIVSAVIIENGAHLPEQGIDGYPNNTAIYLIFQYILLFTIAFISTKLLKISQQKFHIGDPRGSANAIIFSLYSTWLIFVFILLVHYGFPIFKWVDRYEFWGAVPGYFKTIFYQQWPLILAAASFANSRFAFVSLFSIIIIDIIFLEKFSGIILLLMLYLQGVCIRGVRINLSVNRVLSVLLFLALMIFLIFIHYERVDGDGIVALLNRIASQSHMIWGAFNYCIYTNCGFDSTLITNLLIDDISGKRSLLHWSMLIISPEIAYQRIDTGGADFTMGFPSAYIISIGHGATFCIHIAFILLFLIVYKFLTMLRVKNNLFSFLFMSKIYIDLIGFYTIGSVSIIFNTKTLMYVILILCGCVWRLLWKSQKNLLA